MEFSKKYKLIEQLPGEGVQSYRALQMDAGRDVAVHLLVGGKTPENEALLPDSRARTLFNISSLLPDVFIRAAAQTGLKINPGARGFVFNGDPVSVAQFFEMGTRPANLR